MNLNAGVFRALTDAGIKAGDTVFVHSGMRGLVMMMLASGQRQIDLADLAAMNFHDALSNAVGEKGTISAPAFFYDYARNQTVFDVATSIPDRSLGVYPVTLLAVDGMRRSLCPPVSIVSVGNNSTETCNTPAFGYGSLSPWQRLVDFDSKILFWDISPRVMTFVHHIETLVGVPHLYNKIYDTKVNGFDGPYFGPVISAVRYLDERFKIIYNLDRFISDALNDSLIIMQNFGSIKFYVAKMATLAAYLSRKLEGDPFYLLAAAPSFVPGVMPNDGATGVISTALSYKHDKED